MFDGIRTLRQALRGLRATPTFTAAAILTLALGIGANTAAFSLLDRLLLNAFPFRAPERLVCLWEVTDQGRRQPPSVPLAEAVEQGASSFEGLTLMRPRSVNLAGAGEPVQLRGAEVSLTFFDVLGAPPAFGQGFLAEDDRPGAVRGVVLSHACWQRSFGGDPGILGRTLTLNGAPAVVRGVAGRDFRLPPTTPIDAAEVYFPAIHTDEIRSHWDWHSYWAVARLKPGVSLTSADQDVKRVLAVSAGLHPEALNGRTGRAIGLREQVSSVMAPQLLLILGVTLVVLLIACANVASLMLARGLARQRELATRVALGASPGDLVRDMLAEGLLLACGGFLASLLLGWGFMKGFPRILPPDLVGALHLGMDGRALTFTAGLSLLAVLVFAALPAWKVSRSLPFAALKEGSRGTSGKVHQRLRRVLVAGEVALAAALLLSAGLLLRGLERTFQGRAGYRTEGLLTAQFRLAGPAYAGPEAAQAFARTLETRLAALPGVTHAALGLGLPGVSSGSSPLAVEGQVQGSGRGTFATDHRVTADMLQAMGIPLLKGRGLEAQDGAGVCLVSEVLAARAWPGQDPLGRRISLEGPNGPWLRVVGVTAALRAQAEPGEPTAPEVYSPLSQVGTFASASLALRTEEAPEVLIPALRTLVRELDPTLPLARVMTGAQLREQSVGGVRFAIRLAAGFSLIALVLAGVGIYGVMSLMVELRIREIGIRMALGATVRAILTQVLGEGLRTVLWGLALGLLAGLGLGRVLMSLLEGLSPLDPVSLGSVILLMALTALTAALLPALRAAHIEPVQALRADS